MIIDTWFKKAIVAGLILLALTMTFFWQVIFTPNTWMPAGGGDLVPFLYPNYRFAAQTLRQGVIPLWNPHLYGGLPFAADAQSGLFYPINLLVFLLQPDLSVRVLEFLAIFHFWLAGFGMFLYLQHSPLANKLNIHLLAALTGAIAFEFSDLFIVHFGNLNMIAVAAWLPLVMLTFQKGVQQKSVGWAAAAGVILAVATLASHMQITLFILLALGLYTLWEIALPEETQGNSGEGRTRQPGSQRPALSLPNGSAACPEPAEWAGGRFAPLKYLLIALALTIGLSALWLIPTLEMSRYTLRADLTYQETAAYSLEPVQLVGLLIPNYFGRDPALHWGPWERVETGYVGVLTLLLAIMAVFLQGNRQARFLLFLGGISFLLALGDNSFLHGWLSFSPGFGQFRAPARYILLLDFSLAALAAVGLNELMRGLSPLAQQTYNQILKVLTRLLGGLIVVGLPLAYFALLITQDRHEDIFRRAQAAASGMTIFAVLTAISLIALHLARTGRLRRAALGLSVFAIILFDLFSLGANVDVGHNDPTTGFNHPEALAYLEENAGINRVEVTTDIWHLWQPNTALLNGLYDAWGLYNPLTLADPTRYWQQAGRRDSAAYNLLGVKYIIASKAGAPADGDIVPVFDADPAVNIYLNRNAIPRIHFVTEAKVVDSHEAAWEALKSADFDPWASVILENAAGLAPPSPGVNIQPPPQPSPLQGREAVSSPEGAEQTSPEIALLNYGLQNVEIGVKTDAPGFLILSDTYYPGWQATLNGEETPIYRANYAFRAVYIPAGAYTLRFEFKPLSWKIGLAVSALAALAIFGVFVGRRMKNETKDTFRNKGNKWNYLKH